MKIKDVLKNVAEISIIKDCNPVDSTIVELLQKYTGCANISSIKNLQERMGFAVASGFKDIKKLTEVHAKGFEDSGDWIYFQLNSKGQGIMLSPKTGYFYGFASYLVNNLLDEAVEKYEKGVIFYHKFKWHRSLFDVYIAQTARTNRKLNIEQYFQNLAETGITHVEVNGLAFPEPLEAGVQGEVYPRFYTYCPALDQFTTSFLNEGIYPEDYVKSNMDNLKRLAGLALKYGITPGLLCFEPRSVPDELLTKYPMLRGARVDHPLRSLKPRYNLSLCHPVVKKHYSEMLKNIMKEVPEIEYISIWTNDSGAGFELTKSLYVGPNTGGYLIREWKSDRENSEAAARNVVDFFNLLKDAGREINPDFRVITRREALYAEEDLIIKKLGGGIDFEVSSHLSKGYGSAYSHPLYEDVEHVQMTLFQNKLKPGEKTEINKFQKKGINSHFIHTPGTMNNFEPLIGIPFPWLVYDKLRSMHELKIDYTIFYGGGAPSSLAPYNINQEIVKEFIYNEETDIDKIVEKMAKKWAGEKYSGDLRKFWTYVEEGIRNYLPVFLYSLWGITWYRLWIRPLIPDIEKISENDSKYYEEHMLTTPHNPTRVDLNRDVGFTLMPLDFARKTVERIDMGVWKKIVLLR
ncbi:hypothetical protein ACFL4T_14160, partial [candidate division KSB1 bacterium]